ncbi:MAG: glycoside hydrolase family 9 protein [Opitutaceae bacterium]|nr:glycoside hydrolase family 9 protein [Cytophagales bacterium]
MKSFTSITLGVMCSFIASFGQTSNETDFTTLTNWSTKSPSQYSIIGVAGTLQLTAGPGITYQTADYTFPLIDVSGKPYIQVDIKSSQAVVVRIDFLDSAGKTTNTSDTRVSVPGNGTFGTYVFNLTDKFSQTYPSDTANGKIPFVVNSKAINKISVFINPSNTPSTKTTTVFFDNLKIGSSVILPPPPSGIRVNQIGYYPFSPKTGVLAEVKASKFYLVTLKGDTAFTGNVPAQVKYELSGEMVSIADFTSFEQEGTYTLNSDTLQSAPFKIGHHIHHGVSKGLIKGFYFNRATTAIVDPVYSRTYNPARDKEITTLVHSSANTISAPTGTSFNSTKGWFDAGDYNKYVVNAGITTYSMLALYEHYPAYFDTLNNNIPESGNGLADILDEAIWELQWLLTTQTKEGSVYHKITQLQFPGMNVMPNNDLSQRYAVGIGTASTCDFAAVMAQASRILANPAMKDKLPFPGFADTLLYRAEKAYAWAEQHPNVLFTQNPSDVGTGWYSDGNASDEMGWARTELFITTKDKDKYFLRDDGTTSGFGVPGYTSSSTLGLMSLVLNRSQIATSLSSNVSDTAIHKFKLLALAKQIKNSMSAYGVPFGSSIYNFSWGSNAVAGNQGMILLQAYEITKDKSYFNAALANMDYLLGKNATGYSFITGFGTKTPMNPHHRISYADAVVKPIPGMVVGGANRSPDGANEGITNTYPPEPARSYLDELNSYSTNEPAINYAAGVMYLANGLEAIMGLNGNFPLAVDQVTESFDFTLNLYPNPSKDDVTVEFKSTTNAKITFKDLSGNVVMEKVTSNNSSRETFSTTGLNSGVYFIILNTDKGSVTKKLIKL